MADLSKYVLITGASSGIGESSCLLLAERGFNVFAGVRKQEDAEKLRSKNIIPVFIDINDYDSIEKTFNIVLEKCGDKGLLGLVNNAGIAVAGPLEFLPIDRLKLQMETNLISQVKVIQTFLPLIRQAKGRIINMSSIAGFTAFPFKGAYCASKHALEAISDSLRRELSPWGIHVCCIEPGIIRTNIWDRSMVMLEESMACMPEQAKKYYMPFYKPLMEKTRKKVEKKAISPENVARAVLDALSSDKPRTRYLVGKDADFLNLMKYLPDNILDRCICSKTGMKKNGCE